MDPLSARLGLDVVIVDDDAIVRRAVAAVLADHGVEVIADTPSGREGARVTIELAPAVVVVDPELPDIGGLEFIELIHGAVPGVAILLLSSVEDEMFAIQALRAGASGYLSKRYSLDILPRIVRSMAAGEAVVTRSLTMRLVERLREMPETGAGLRPVRSTLSSREWEVLDLICAGAGTRDIAEDLELSIETVRSHVKRILRKLGVHSRQEAAEIAALMLAERALPEVPERPGVPRHASRFTRR